MNKENFDRRRKKLLNSDEKQKFLLELTTKVRSFWSHTPFIYIVFVVLCKIVFATNRPCDRYFGTVLLIRHDSFKGRI